MESYQSKPLLRKQEEDIFKLWEQYANEEEYHRTNSIFEYCEQNKCDVVSACDYLIKRFKGYCCIVLLGGEKEYVAVEVLPIAISSIPLFRKYNFTFDNFSIIQDICDIVNTIGCYKSSEHTEDCFCPYITEISTEKVLRDIDLLRQFGEDCKLVQRINFKIANKFDYSENDKGILLEREEKSRESKFSQKKKEVNLNPEELKNLFTAKSRKDWERNGIDIIEHINQVLGNCNGKRISAVAAVIHNSNDIPSDIKKMPFIKFFPKFSEICGIHLRFYKKKDVKPQIEQVKTSLYFMNSTPKH